MIWAAFLLPSERGKASPQRSVEDFGRNMEMLADTEGRGSGRWIVTPRKGVPFLGSRERARARARERRRRVFVFFVESIGLTFLIGLVPPLHAIWYATMLLVGLLGVYVWLLVSLRERSPETQARHRVRDANVPEHARPTRERHVAERHVTRPAFNGLGALGGDESANIVVRPARGVGMAGI